MPTLSLPAHGALKAVGGLTLVDSVGLPRYCATIWAEAILAGLAPNTRSRHLYAVDRLYRAVESEGAGNLDRMLIAADFDAIETALLSFYTRLRNETGAKESSGSHVWKSVTRFVNEILSYLGAKAESRAKDIDARIRRVKRLYEQLSPSPRRPPLPIRALPSLVVRELCDVFHPNDSRNPFRSDRERWRNYLIFALLLHTGLRRGELAMLPVDAVHSSYDDRTDTERFWINVGRSPYSSQDSRREKPAVKTRFSSRQLPISSELVSVVDLVSVRKKQDRSHPFLFGSQKGGPLNLRSIQRIFEIATMALTNEAKKTLRDRGVLRVTAHSLRHTCAVYRLSRYVDGGDNLDLACEKLRAFFGWSPASPMPRHYGRAYFEAAAAQDWSENYDALVNSLRRFDGAN